MTFVPRLSIWLLHCPCLGFNMHLQHKSSVTQSTVRQRSQLLPACGFQHHHPRSQRPTAAGAVAQKAAGIGHSSSLPQQLQQQQQQFAVSSSTSSSRRRVVASAAAATSSLDLDELIGPAALEPEVFEIITYTLKLAWTSETYYVHSWMVLLGLLKKENSIACDVSNRRQSSCSTRPVLHSVSNSCSPVGSKTCSCSPPAGTCATTAWINQVALAPCASDARG